MSFITFADAAEIVSPAQVYRNTPALAARRRFDILTEEMTEDQVALCQNLSDDLAAIVAKYRRELEIAPDLVFAGLAEACEGSFEGVTARALISWSER